MRVALIADIHGNLVALESVLHDISSRSVEQIVCLGDVASTGPQPLEVMNLIRTLNCLAVMGNADAELLNPMDESSAWSREHLHAEHLDYIRTFQPTVEVPLGAGATLLCFHGSPRSYDDIIMSTTSIAEVEQMIAGHYATILAGGHTHVQMIRRHKDMMIINPGSVGLPYDKNPWSNEVPRESVRLAPWSEYAIITYHAGQLGVELLRVPLDIDAVKRSAFLTDWPDAKGWAENWRT